MKNFLISSVLGAALLLSSNANAQAIFEPRDFNVERFTLASSREGIFSVEAGNISRSGDYDLHLWLGTSNDPLVIYQSVDGERTRVGSLVKQRSDGQIGGSMVVTRWLQLSLDATVVFQQNRNTTLTGVTEPVDPLAQYGLGDLRLMAKLRLLQQSKHGVDVAFAPVFEIPSGGGSEYRGAKHGAFAPQFAVGQRLGRFHWAANLGYLLRKQTRVGELRVDDELQFRGGIGVSVSRRLELAGSLSTATAANSFVNEFGRNHVEFIGGPIVNLNQKWQLLAAGGAGLGAGYGTPDWRVLAGLRYSRVTDADQDWDADGMIETDKCPHSAEDMDGFQDADGCPDLDNDQDTIADKDDVAPNEPEDRDGFEDSDGKPELDNDKDGLNDQVDKCPNEGENSNGFQDDDGCPDVGDQDHDGVNDDVDKCVDQPEDKDGFEDTDGCAELDNDRDGIVDGRDRCTLTAGPVENYGCPDSDEDTDGVVYRVDVCPNEVGTKEFEGCKMRQKVTLKGGKLVVIEPVFFKTNKAIIQPVSFGLLDNVGRVLADHAEFRVQIQGHTDNQGNDSYNKDLSARRAAAVLAYLVTKGIPAARLESAGFGEDQPVLDNKTAKGRAANRRVAFVILSIDGFDVRAINNENPSATLPSP